jgi:hypothetical protein
MLKRVLVLALLAGCRAGTFVVVRLESAAPLDGIANVSLDLALGARHATRELRGPIALPADFAVDVQSGDGTLTLHARALDAAGGELADGDAMVEVRRDHTARVTLTLVGPGAPDGGAPDGNADAAPGALHADPSPLAFGLVALGATRSLTVTVTNGGATDGPPLAPALSGDAGFKLTDVDCGGRSLPPGGHCTVSIDFAPSTAGAVTATLTLTPSLAVAVSGEGRETVTLDVSTAGDGLGSVQSNGAPGSIGCPSACSAKFFRGSTVTLTGTPATGSQLTGWSAPECTGVGDCTLTLDGPRAVIATFTLRSFTVTLDVTGSGSGASTPTGINACTSHCTAMFKYGTAVHLRATPAAASWTQWAGCPTALGANCDLTVSADIAIKLGFNPRDANFVFVTSTTYAATAIGGLSGADAKCAARAAEAGLGGTYVAWLSATGPSNAITRLGSAHGWRRTDFLPFANTQADLTSGKLLYPPRFDEFGRDVGNPMVLTATKQDGTFVGTTTNDSCNDWSATATPPGFVTGGFPAEGAYAWTRGAIPKCTTPSPIYCFGTDLTNDVSVPSPSPSTRIAFYLDNPKFDSSTGRDAADTLCANNHGTLSGTFKALLATTSSAPLDPARISSTGGAWYRPDGVRVADYNGLSQMIIAAPMEVRADGSHAAATGGFAFAFTGTAGPNLPTQPGINNCTNWSVKDVNQSAEGMNGSSSDPQFFQSASGSCTPNPIICLQQ